MQAYNKIIHYYLKKKLAEASSAGYAVATETTETGLQLNFDGYNEKFPQLVEIVTDFLPKSMDKVDESTINMIREALSESFTESSQKQYNLQSDLKQKVLLKVAFFDTELYREIGNVTLEALKLFTFKYFSQLKVKILAQGNVTKSQTLDIVDIIRRNLNAAHIPDAWEYKKRCYQLPVGSSALRAKSLMENDDNSCLVNYYQVGLDSLRRRSMLRLIIKIVNPKAFDYLRSKEQLGYGVAGQFDGEGGVLGLNVVVLSQEGKNAYSKVAMKMETFMNEVVRKAVEELSDEEFQSLKESRIKTLLADDLDLSTEMGKNWIEISDEDYVFNKWELAANVTREMTKAELQDFFKSFTQPANKRMLSVHVIGNKHDDESVNETTKKQKMTIELVRDKLPSDETVIDSIDEFHQDLELYPVAKFEL